MLSRYLTASILTTAGLFAGSLSPFAAVQAEMMSRATDVVALPEAPVNLSGYQSFILRLEQNIEGRTGGTSTGPNAGSGAAPALFAPTGTTATATTANTAAVQQQRLIMNPNEGFQVDNGSSWVNPDTGEVTGLPAVAATRTANADTDIPQEPVSLSQGSRLGISDVIAEAPGATSMPSTATPSVSRLAPAAGTLLSASNVNIAAAAAAAPIPEPATGFGIGIALIAAGIWNKKRNRA